MPSDLVTFEDKPETARYLIAGWRRQWANGGRISSGLPRYLVEKTGARKIGQMSNQVAQECYPFQVAGTHDTFRPSVAYRDGLPVQPMQRENDFYDAGGGLIVFLGEEPWSRLDLYAEAFFGAIRELGISQTVAVEGVNGAVPPEVERRVTCVYSREDMRDTLERYGLQFSSYGSEGRRGPTIGMALITLAHFQYPDVAMFRLSALSPLYPFVTNSGEPIGIARDHRSFYDIMRRLNHLFHLDIDLSELAELGRAESDELNATLDGVAAANPSTREIIERARSDYNYTPYVDPVELDPELDRTLEDILRGWPPQNDPE